MGEADSRLHAFGHLWRGAITMILLLLLLIIIIILIIILIARRARLGATCGMSIISVSLFGSSIIMIILTMLITITIIITITITMCYNITIHTIYIMI